MLLSPSFFDFLEKNSASIVLVSLLKNVEIETNSNNYVIYCPNNGIRLFLENKKVEVEEFFNLFFKKKLPIIFVLKPQKTKKVIESLPLIDYGQKIDSLISQSGIITKYVFENFAVSPSNQIAYSAALSVSENPGRAYNPLFIYGGVGVGKTHLAHATAYKILKGGGGGKVYACTSEEFTNDLIDLIQRKNTPVLRKKYRSLGVFVVDDIQFIAGKNYVQEEFFHTFNTIVKNGGQIILTSDRPPYEIQKLEERLQSRFLGGLTIDIQKPDFELRTAIVLIKAKERNINIEVEAAKKIAEKITDTRQLEGYLLKVYSKTTDKFGLVSLDLVKKEVSGYQKSVNNISPASVLNIVGSYYGVRVSQIKNPTRKESVVKVRHLCMYLLRDVLKMNFGDIAYLLKKKDHTTIMHGVNKISASLISNIGFKEEVDKIISIINQ